MKPSIDVERVICALAELEDPGSRAFTIGRGDWPVRGFVVRRGAVVYGYLNRCPHLGSPLNLRPHDFLAPGGSLLLCNSHGALFEISTGLCLAGPCAGARLRSIPLQVEGGFVFLDPGYRVADFID